MGGAVSQPGLELKYQQGEADPFIIFTGNSNQTPGCVPTVKTVSNAVPETYECDGKSSRSNSLASKDSGLGGEKQEKLLKHTPVEGEREAEGEDTNGDDIFWKKVLIIFSILNVLLLVTVCVVVFGIPGSQQEGMTVFDDGQCLDCMDVYLTEDDKLDNIYEFEKRGNMCCSENQTRLIQKYVIKRYKSDQAKASAQSYIPRRTAMHLLLDTDDMASKTSGTNQKLKWKKVGSLINGNLSLSSDGRHIIAKRDGIYYISPKVVFNDSMTDVVEENLLPMLLQVSRRRSGQDQLLLENKHTHCANSQSKCDIPSSTQGVFELEAGDSLNIMVRKPCGLVLTPGLNYVDVYMI